MNINRGLVTSAFEGGPAIKIHIDLLVSAPVHRQVFVYLIVLYLNHIFHF